MKKYILLILTILLLSSCSIKIPSRVLEKNIDLANTIDQDLGSQLVKQVDTLDLKGSTSKTFDSKVKIVLKDTSSNDKIAIRFEEGTQLEFRIILSTRIEDNLVFPNIQKLHLKSTLPIAFTHNGRKLGAISEISSTSNNKIKADIKSLSIANLILLLIDNSLLSKESPRFRLKNAESKFPDLFVEHLKFKFSGMDILEDSYKLKVEEPFEFQIVNFELSDNLRLMNLGEIGLPLKNAKISTDNINLNISTGVLGVKDYAISLIDSGYSIVKKDEGQAFLRLGKGNIESDSSFISKGSFRNLFFDLTEYNYKAVAGNSIVNGSIRIKGRIGYLKNRYNFRSSKYYYVLRPFELNDLVIYYSDDGQGNLTRKFSLTNELALNFRDLYFQDFGQYEFHTEGVKLRIPPTDFERIENIRLDTKGSIDISTDKTKLFVYNGSGKKLYFPQGNRLKIEGIEDFYFLKNNTLKFDTLKISGNLNLRIEELDSTPVFEATGKSMNFKAYERDNEIKYELIGSEIEIGNDDIPPAEISGIPKVFRGAKIKIKETKFYGDGTKSFNGLQILIPKKYIIEELQRQLRKQLVKDYGRVGEMKVRIKDKIGPFKISLTLVKIGIYVNVFDAYLNYFNFTGANNFNFSVGGRVRIKTKHLRDTKTIRGISGKGNITFIPGTSLDNMAITIGLQGTGIDIRNFPGEIEQILGDKIRSDVKQSSTFSPFQSLNKEERAKLSKVVIRDDIKIFEEGNYFVFECNATIKP